MAYMVAFLLEILTMSMFMMCGYIDRATRTVESQLAEQACENHSLVIQSLHGRFEIGCLHYRA